MRILILILPALTLFGCATHQQANKLLNMEKDRPEAVIRLANDIKAAAKQGDTQAVINRADHIEAQMKGAKTSMELVADNYEIEDDGKDYSDTFYVNPDAAAPQQQATATETENNTDPTQTWWWMAGQLVLSSLGVGGLGIGATKVVRRVRKGMQYESMEEALEEGKEVFRHVSSAIDALPENIKNPVKEQIKVVTNLADRMKIEEHLKEAREVVLMQSATRNANKAQK